MVFPFRRRSIVRSVNTNFVTSGSNPNGVFNFDRYLDFAPDDFHIKLAFNYYVLEANVMASVRLEFVNPTPLPDAVDLAGTNTDRREILVDATGTLYSFVEDNLGTWWTLPMRTRPDLPYEVHFATTGHGDSAVQTLAIDIAYFPNWPSQCLGATLRDRSALPDRDPR